MLTLQKYEQIFLQIILISFEQRFTLNISSRKFFWYIFVFSSNMAFFVVIGMPLRINFWMVNSNGQRVKQLHEFIKLLRFSLEFRHQWTSFTISSWEQIFSEKTKAAATENINESETKFDLKVFYSISLQG